ncbi:hypothetical protein [Pseudonocardia abyssalis]|jgi:hypothetical protein|uniref:Uncharacterized protein n=1 Tax=Pseudonocardia abyssalis TaxID=2792008 RepID=A0ABS6V0X9_9PSEU|nr:hypothetical protein [Pseudonocardia abyssalis]MBW0119492.1 hypothetical protein [Pseudonocardia abyssalis]MBW0138160.1 hypothetical protein [Pseudonocardia abyssalis]
MSRSHPSGGRHELGQNHLVDERLTRRIAALVTPGAPTRHLVGRADPVTGVRPRDLTAEHRTSLHRTAR